MKHLPKMYKRSREAPLPWIGLVLFVGANCAASPQTFYVSPEGSGQGGHSWETAFLTISEALQSAATADHVWIRSGTYCEALDIGPGVQLYGGFAGTEATSEFTLRDIENNPTILDATGRNQSVVLAESGGVLDGLTITGGQSDLGGGVYCTGTALDIRNCKIYGNRTEGIWRSGGGGVYCKSGSLRISNTDIFENEVQLLHPHAKGAFPSDLQGYGGGIYVEEGSLLIESSSIRINQLMGPRPDQIPMSNFFLEGGGVFVNGYCRIASSTIQANEIEGHIVGHQIEARGGGLAVHGQTDIRNAMLLENRVRSSLLVSEGMFLGGGVFVRGRCGLVNSVVTRNQLETGSVSGSNVINSGYQVSIHGTCDILNSTVDDPDRPLTGCVSGDDLNLLNCIVNCERFDGEESVSITAAYSVITGGYPGEGNIDAQVEFVDSDSFDFQLLPNSPAIDAATEVDLASDILGATRPVDIPGVGREGPGAFDMGAYEFQLSDLTQIPTKTPTVTPTFGDPDLDGSGSNDAPDLFLFQRDWLKPMPPTPGPTLVKEESNLNSDSRVGPKDLLIMIQEWKNTIND